jgi:predicted DNA-binding protein (UPF0278 family)|tara:strand:+ start:22 stop:255 length:234 start_codon:yes stop_codon:yes gene_type:complete
LAQLVLNHVAKIDELQDEVIQNSDSILPSIDLDELLKSPESYLLSLGLSFLNEHIDEIEKGAKQGKKFAEEVLKKSG